MNLLRYRKQNQKKLADFHIHTTYCDGLCQAEEIAKEALRKGMKTIGFSGHCYTFYDESYCMLPEDVARYRNDISALKEKYTGKLEILCGVEQDCLAGMPKEPWDYVIGSVHYIHCRDEKGNEEFVPVDETEEILKEAADRWFHGDMYALVEKYYETLETVVEATSADLIGHFDIITKCNRGGESSGGNHGQGILFNENHPRYMKAWKKAADRLVKTGIPFEINTAPLTKGFRKEPYPAKPIQEYLRKQGAEFLYSSDSHRVQTLGAWDYRD